jgi:hypothetical protein
MALLPFGRTLMVMRLRCALAVRQSVQVAAHSNYTALRNSDATGSDAVTADVAVNAPHRTTQGADWFSGDDAVVASLVWSGDGFGANRWN